MLYSKEQIENKITELWAYSASQNEKHADEYTTFTDKLELAVNDYFNNHNLQLAETIKELVHNLYCDILERETVTEKYYGDPLPTNYPVGYNDITQCFYQFPLMNTTEEQFHAAWVYAELLDEQGNPVTENGDPVFIVDHNALIDEWINDIVFIEKDELGQETGRKTYIANNSDFEAVQALLSWVQSSASANYLPQLLEDFGAVTSSPSTQEVGERIYIDKKLLEVIETLNLNVYIPSYVQGG